MEKWKEEILEAYRQGKKIQTKSGTQDWHDFVPQNQLDRPNVDHGTEENWRIKPKNETFLSEKLEREMFNDEQLLDIPAPLRYHNKDKKEDKKYTKDQMFLFAGFCMGKKMSNPGVDIGDILDEFNSTFGHG